MIYPKEKKDDQFGGVLGSVGIRALLYVRI